MPETSGENDYAEIHPFVSADCIQGFILQQHSRSQQFNSINPFEETFHELEGNPGIQELESANSVSKSDSAYILVSRQNCSPSQVKRATINTTEGNPLNFKDMISEETLPSPTTYHNGHASSLAALINSPSVPAIHDHNNFQGCINPSEFNRDSMQEILNRLSPPERRSFHGGYSRTDNNFTIRETSNRTEAGLKSLNNFWWGASPSAKLKKVKVRRKLREPRFCFQTMSDVDVLDDGYKWRKYGQKVVKNTHHPRSYYRCTQSNCRVKKRVERLAEDPRMVMTTYEGRHTHSPCSDTQSEQPDYLNSL